ncbi:spermidine synthase [Flavobacterium aquatile]|uniref:Spermidine synthase n=1 Tax=Flavobacterium aquatile LMG 4008 = ATCC 11947 TaxID=1453498 RepID=A0A095SSU7_9FLAO|nr:fused MFS/spermidine synthase [Flavobacterium aquatile]KGD67716.1 spermidine synthase [Flavobacterium aquatile LMG 4008 = ATCC 11947]OXA67579.1 spermidine synthase [Flavobacterium aquatile] [Flavobacterium aquatile LMG 4008 = ATCC 11947]GEC78211.1 spermidine synthase [Flavobacterium aquatile]
MFAKFFSYFIPINVYKKNSSISKSLEVTWNNGELVLDSKNTNYSYGSLQRILKKGLKYIGYERIKKFDSILILGVAGGSVIKTLVDDVKFKGKITGVEIDAEIIEIAKKYFKLDAIKNLELHVDDAFEFVLKTKENYDLIIIDIFQDTKMPNFLFEDFFINRINLLLNPEGFILFNTMVINEKDRIRNLDYRKKFNGNYSIRMYPKVEIHNELFTIKKLSN